MFHKKDKATKLRVVYDASVKSETGFLLNDCLEKGTPLQNKLWDVLVRLRFHPVILCADIKKPLCKFVFERGRDCLRFHWVEATNNDKIEIYHFAGLVFGLTQSPFILVELWIFILTTLGKSFERLLKM